uniref:Uncharacterized protein n=1 Tax=Hyaloperonospora arabidopsidis (strain Emoy2) TaxID=559515 RepID=M4BK92_HYAAE
MYKCETCFGSSGQVMRSCGKVPQGNRQTGQHILPIPRIIGYISLACKKTRPTTSAVVTTSRAAVYHPPFCYCAIWQREKDFNCSRYLCFSRIERLVISCWSAGDPYWPKRSERMHTRTCASLA